MKASRAALLDVALVAGACGSWAQAAGPRIAVVTLVAGLTPANGTLNFNGYSRGALTLTVPVHWRVRVRYQNRSALRHSFLVIPRVSVQPDSAPGPPAFPGAATRDPVGGIGPGREEILSFMASRAGTYEFVCGVLGHAQAGMWDILVVSPTARAIHVQPAGAVAVTAR